MPEITSRSASDPKAADAPRSAASPAARSSAPLKDPSADPSPRAAAPAAAAVSPPSPVASSSTETPEQADRRQKAEYRAKAARLFAAFMCPEVGLGDIPASLLAAHCMETMDDPEAMGGTEAIAWALAFKQQNPIVWGNLRIGHLTNLIASLRRADIASGSPEELALAATVIRG